MANDSGMVEVIGEQLVARFCNLVDSRDYSGAAALFHSDGVLVHGSNNVTGHAEIAASFTDHYPTVVSAHFISNATVDRVDDDKANIQAYCILYHYDSGSPPVLPVPLTGPIAIVTLSGEVERRDGSWKLSRLIFDPPFMMVTDPPFRTAPDATQ